MKKFSYAVLGSGKWGKRIEAILREMSRPVTVIHLSRPNDLDINAYAEQLDNAVNNFANDADIVWVAVPPGHQGLIVKTLLSHKKHIILEKPWICDEAETAKLVKIAKAKGLFVGVDFQYCFLEALQNISNSDLATNFSGCFTVARTNRLSIPSLYNLGSHLMAIKNLYFPLAEINKFITGYEQLDKRLIEITFPERAYEIDLLNQQEPLIQRLMEKFENCIWTGKEFPLNLNFAGKVYWELVKN